MRLKYILTEYKSFAIFSDTHVHADVARGLYGKPVSAGFCHLNTAIDDTITVICYGESISMNLKSRPEDGEIITRKLNSDAY